MKSLNGLPDSSILKEYYDSASRTLAVPDLINGFESLNAKLTQHLDRHHTIGHTFFMMPHFDTQQLKRVWDRKRYPLIEEYFFDEPQIAAEFVLSEFWPSTV